MSAPVAGKFQDHYVVLELTHKATDEQIKEAFERLSIQYDPIQGTEPDYDKFEALTLAYEVLSDADLRKDFNKLKGIGLDDKPKFSGLPFFEALARPSGLRAALLCVLYDYRRLHPFTPAISVRHALGMLEGTEEEVNFAIWYLKQRNLIVNDDKSNLMITADGLDYLENQRPTPEAVMKFLKPDEDATESATI